MSTDAANDDDTFKIVVDKKRSNRTQRRECKQAERERQQVRTDLQNRLSHIRHLQIDLLDNHGTEASDVDFCDGDLARHQAAIAHDRAYSAELKQKAAYLVETLAQLDKEDAKLSHKNKK
jgi:hypothetical protein